MLAGEPAARGYRMPRVTWHLGRWIRTTDWYPDYQLRLYDRRAGGWNGAHVHESVRGRRRRSASCAASCSTTPIATSPITSQTIDRYTTLRRASRRTRDGRRRRALLQLAVHPPLAFLRNYISRGGIRDGAAGLSSRC